MNRGKVYTVMLIGLLGIGACGGGEKEVVIGSKDFTEQKILREMMAALIEGNSDIKAEQKVLDGTLICWNSLRNGEIDLYAEYTGTALASGSFNSLSAKLMAILKQEPLTDPQEAINIVDLMWICQQHGLIWLEPLGFNNTYTLMMRRDQAQELGVQKISDLGVHKDKLTSGFTHDFLERPEDGYPGLIEHYGWSLEKEPKRMDHGLIYKAIAEGDVDLICGFATDGQISADLVKLEDDEQFFPKYYAAPIVRADTLKKYPELEDILSKLAGKIDNKTMAQLNYEVDEKGRQAAEVAGEFLQKSGLMTE